jgi:DNA-binding NtrC family response regulator
MALHILVVDHDEDVRNMLVEMLHFASFLTTAANSGGAMRHVLAGEGLAVDAIVLDCRMPGEPSARLALLAKSLRLPVVMISGHIEAMKFAEENHLQLLPKPFRMVHLLNAIRKAMESRELGQRGD